MRRTAKPKRDDLTMVHKGSSPCCDYPVRDGECMACGKSYCPKCGLELDNGECEDCDE